MFTVSFQYDEAIGKWEIIASGAENAIEALQGFNAVIHIACQAYPVASRNRAVLLPDGTYKISVGQ